MFGSGPHLKHGGDRRDRSRTCSEATFLMSPRKLGGQVTASFEKRPEAKFSNSFAIVEYEATRKALDSFDPADARRAKMPTRTKSRRTRGSEVQAHSVLESVAADSGQ